MSVLVVNGDARCLPLADESVNCIVTSPPFWGLRDYGVDGQIGLEDTVDGWIAELVEVFRECRRVLRPDGVMWVECGDGYAGSRCGPQGESGERAGRGFIYERSTTARSPGLKPKDLIGQPWRLAFALQADGWWLRSDCIWARPNPMPESVTDRPTKSHSYVFLLTKAARYWYDSDAVRGRDAGQRGGNGFAGRQGGARPSAVNGGRGSVERFEPGSGANLRTVWTIPTHAYPGAHFATFPPKLAERCIKAGCPREVCSECGAPWVRVVDKRFEAQPDVCEQRGVRGHNGQKPMDGSNGWQGTQRGTTQAITVGWQPTCPHEAPTRPGVVLDPFGGSGTTGMVAAGLGRRAVLVELNRDYIDLARDRVTQRDMGAALRPKKAQNGEALPLFGGAA